MTYVLLIAALCGGGWLVELRQGELVAGEHRAETLAEANQAAETLAYFLVHEEPRSTVWTTYAEKCR